MPPILITNKKPKRLVFISSLFHKTKNENSESEFTYLENNYADEYCKYSNMNFPQIIPY